MSEHYHCDPDYVVPENELCSRTKTALHPLLQYTTLDGATLYTLACECECGGAYTKDAVVYVCNPDDNTYVPYVHERNLVLGRVGVQAFDLARSLQQSLLTLNALHEAITARVDNEIQQLKQTVSQVLPLVERFESLQKTVTSLQEVVASLEGQLDHPGDQQQVQPLRSTTRAGRRAPRLHFTTRRSRRAKRHTRPHSSVRSSRV